MYKSQKKALEKAIKKAPKKLLEVKEKENAISASPEKSSLIKTLSCNENDFNISNTNVQDDTVVDNSVMSHDMSKELF